MTWFSMKIMRWCELQSSNQPVLKLMNSFITYKCMQIYWWWWIRFAGNVTKITFWYNSSRTSIHNNQSFDLDEIRLDQLRQQRINESWNQIFNLQHLISISSEFKYPKYYKYQNIRNKVLNRIDIEKRTLNIFNQLSNS
jgi:hypothetical protein